jgi:GDPmannose 4,6-dehydratase
MTALIFGVSSQDARFLTKVLKEADETVIGVVSKRDQARTELLKELPFDDLIPADFSCADSIQSVIHTMKAAKVFNLVGYSSVHASFKEPIICADTNYLFFQRLLLAALKSESDPHIFQCSSSEMFAGSRDSSVSEQSHAMPISPYGVSKTAAHYLASTYRNAHNLRVSTGILFNHESEFRTPRFFSKRVVIGLVDVFLGKADRFTVDRLDFWRDWSYAADFAKAFQVIAEQSKPDDYVVAAGKLHSGRDFVRLGMEYLGIGSVIEDVVSIQSTDLRPADHDGVVGDTAKITSSLGWTPRVTFEEMIRIMIDAEIASRGK